MGLLVTMYVYVVYIIALKFEGCAASSHHNRARLTDAAKAIHRHDLLHTLNARQKIAQGALSHISDPRLPTTRTASHSTLENPLLSRSSARKMT